MVLTAFFRCLSLALLGLVVLIVSPVAAQRPAPDDPGTGMMDYYKSPDAAAVESVLGTLDKVQIKGRNNVHGSLVGFLSEVLRRDPSRAAGFAARDYTGNGRIIMSDTLWFAGESERAVAYATRVGGSKEFIARLRDQPTTIKALPIQGSNDLDLHWGAFFASGDLDYVAKIADYVETSAKILPVGKIVAFTGRISRRTSTADMKPWIQSLDRPSQLKFFLATTALWALGGNAKRDTKIADYIALRAAVPEGTPGVPAMRWVSFRLKYPKTTVIGGDTNAGVLMLAGTDADIGTLFARQARGDAQVKATVQNRLAKETPAAQPVFVSYMVMRRSPCEGEARLTVSGPEDALTGGDGENWTFPPSPVKTTQNKSSIVLQTVKIEGDRLVRPGTYRYSITVKVCDQIIGPVQNGLFVY